MTNSELRSRVSCLALAISASIVSGSAYAQTAPAAAEAEDALNTIVVTASTGNRTQLNTSASISAVNAAEIQNFNATSSAELFRLIPGFQVGGTQGDGGNSNIGVRGLRTPTGGSPFVQVQEDGLPTVLFGDIQFGNNDYFTRADPSTERLESIRGGTASTLASQAVGGVLNFISHTGRKEGGYVELEKGVDYDFTKVNARLSGSLSDSTYFNIGGAFDVGRGELHAAFNVSNSYVVKGNITHELADNRGFVRLLFKASDTQEPSYNGCISSATLSGKKVSNIGPSRFCDGRKETADYSALNRSYLRINPGAVPETVPVKGITTNQKYLQFQAHYDFGNGITIDDNARVARIKDNFNVQFYGAGLTANALGAGQSFIYANGPSAGRPFTGQFVSSSVSVATEVSHLDHKANDFSISYDGDFSGNKLNLKAGYFYYSQRIAEIWHANNSTVEAGANGAQLDLVSGLNGTGNLLAVGGQSGFNQSWNQRFDATFTTNAPYANANLDIGNLNLDASVREEFFHGDGFARGSLDPFTGTVGISQIDPRTPNAPPVVTQIGYREINGPQENINFGEHATNWSIGALYKVTPGLSVFTRASRGTRFNADRLTRNTPSYFAPNGSLSAAGLANSRFPVNQYEIGLKNRGGLGGGRYTVELVGYRSTYTISSQEINPIVCTALLGRPATTCTVAGSFRDYGVELFSTYQNHGFNLLLSATYDKSRVKGNPTLPFTKSANIPPLIYNGVVSYAREDVGSLGFSFTGQSSVLGGDGNTYPGSVVFGGFIKAEPIKNIQVGLNVYNLFNTFALQGPAGFIGGTNNTLINAQPARGRSVKASVRLSF